MVFKFVAGKEVEGRGSRLQQGVPWFCSIQTLLQGLTGWPTRPKACARFFADQRLPLWLSWNPPAMWETWVRSLLGEDPLEKWKATQLQYSGLENSIDCIVHGVAKSQTRLSNFHLLTKQACMKQEPHWPEVQTARRAKPITLPPDWQHVLYKQQSSHCSFFSYNSHSLWISGPFSLESHHQNKAERG